LLLLLSFVLVDWLGNAAAAVDLLWKCPGSEENGGGCCCFGGRRRRMEERRASRTGRRR
jgi:hypothetical protein